MLEWVYFYVSVQSEYPAGEISILKTCFYRCLHIILGRVKLCAQRRLEIPGVIDFSAGAQLCKPRQNRYSQHHETPSGQSWSSSRPFTLYGAAPIRPEAGLPARESRVNLRSERTCEIGVIPIISECILFSARDDRLNGTHSLMRYPSQMCATVR